MSTQALQNKQDVEKFTITVPEASALPNLIEVGLITTYELADKVSEILSVAYKDFAGCFITPRLNGAGFDVKLYFCALPTGATNKGLSYAFETVGSNQNQQQKAGLISNLISLERRSSQRIYSLTQHGREGLADFLEIPRGRTNPDWSKHVFEEAQSSNINNGVYAVVTNVDIYKLLALVYGKEKDGEWVQYDLTPVRPIGQAAPGAALDWILKIQRLGMKELDRISRKVGIIQNRGIPMVGRH
jgi:hypothetical protein